MELDAVFQNPAQVPRSATLRSFARKVDDAIALLAQCLRDDYVVTIPRDLRDTQQALGRELDVEMAAADPQTRGALAALKYASDRITDPVNTLAHVLREPMSVPAAAKAGASAAAMSSGMP
jgi:hypothetical protein